MQLIYKLFIAFTLFNNIPDFDDFIFANYQDQLREVAFDLEISEPEEYYESMQVVRDRYDELKNAPKLVDIDRFQLYRYAFENERRVADLYLNFLREENRLLNIDNLEIIGIMEKNIQIWNEMNYSFIGYGSYLRRKSLKYVKESIGDEAFNNGILPPCVPIRLLKRID